MHLSELIHFLTHSLADLKTLRLYRTPSSSPSRPMHSLPFNLTTLVLQLQRTSSSFDLPDALTRQTSIHSLHIGVHDINYSPRLFSSLAPLAPQLVTLHIASNPSRPQAADVVKHCSMLKDLTVDDMSLVSHVVVPLASWTVRSVTPTEISKILDLLESASVSLGDLERLELHSNLWQVQYSPQWPQLEQRCREGKIKLVVHRTSESPRLDVDSTPLLMPAMCSQSCSVDEVMVRILSTGRLEWIRSLVSSLLRFTVSIPLRSFLSRG